MDLQPSDSIVPESLDSTAPEAVAEAGTKQLSRRKLLKAGAALSVTTAATLSVLETLVWTPQRMAHAAPSNLPDIQFDISGYIAPAYSTNNVLVRFGAIGTFAATAQLNRMPSKQDQQVLANALDTIEANYSFSPSGIFTTISYGLPYFNRLPSALVDSNMPRLLSDTTRFALEEAVPSPTDVSPLNPGITKQTFNVPVKIESNDFVFMLRSDSASNIKDVLGWLQGSNRLHGQRVASPRFNGLFTITSTRLSFTQIGLPRKVADQYKLPYASSINPASPLWMSFISQQTAGSGPAAITTFQGNSSAQFTTAKSGDYFFNGSIQHLSHNIQDLAQFYANPANSFTERVQYMFRSNPIPSTGNADQFTDGGGPTSLNNVFQGTNDAQNNAQGVNTYNGERRLGHLTAIQRSSRAADGTPIHIRADGAMYDNMDVPDGSNQPKLFFTAFVPTADFFATMRRNQASVDLAQQYGVSDQHNGIERFITATRRQNFLVPPRVHRAFPLIELT